MKNKQVFKNTFMLYIRQVIVILVTLYTVRVIFNVLGVEDFGIYSVVASIVTMCSFLSGTLASATQRFFSYALGKNDDLLIRQTFSTSLLIYLVICLFSVLILEVVGSWYVDNYLVIPEDRKTSALFLFHISVITFAFSIVIAPLISIMVAHEDMYLFAIISIVEAALKLVSVNVLVKIDIDKLELYGILMLIVSFLISVLYLSICINKYEECQFRKFYFNKKLLKDMYIFSAWTLYGQSSTIAREQGVTILLNQYFNPTVVAARAISTNVANQVNMFAHKFNTGLYPPIIKSYASHDKKEMYSLLVVGSKLTYLLMWVFTLPMITELPFIINAWLGSIPPYTISFIQLALIESLLLALSLPLATAARAPGKMMMYELPLGTIQFLILLVSFVLLKSGYEAISVFYIAIVANFIMFAFRVIIVSKLIGLSIIGYIRDVLVPLTVITALSLILVYLFTLDSKGAFIFSLLNMFMSVLFILLLSFQFGLDLKMKKLVISKFEDIRTKLRKSYD
ncbi:oligosaccharide flippase family protein [Vibrio cholerae]